MSERAAERRAAVEPPPHGAGIAGRGTLSVPGFEVLAELGHGASTAVYRARRVGADGPDVAIKIVRESTDDTRAAAAFRREAALLARVSHPSLAAVYAAGEAGGRPYLVLELVDGVSLARLIEDGPLPEHRVLDVAIDAASALGASHRMRLVHRDVKPANLLVTSGGRTKLIDFDLATWAGELTPADTVAGTLTYSAAEQTGMLRRPVDARTDLYALGVVLFECLTGSPPFASADVGDLLRQHAMEQPPNVRRAGAACSAALAAVVDKLLAKDPDDRYQSATGLVADLRRVRERPDDWPFALDATDHGAAATVPLVGRDSELAHLLARWRQTAARGGGALIEGAHGLGRSRLADELFARAAADACALRATCSPHDRQPLGAIAATVRRHIEAVRQLPADQQPPAVARIRRAAGAATPLLAALSPVAAAVLGADGADVVTRDSTDIDQREQVAVAIAGMVGTLARDAGRLLLVVDDAQHIDPTSERVLAHLFTDDAPVLVALTAPPDALRSLESQLGIALDWRITLEPLAPAAVTELFASELGGADVPAELSAQLTARTGGNPFTILEFLRQLIEAGALQPVWGTWMLDTGLLDRLHLPSDVLDLVLSRLEGLGGATRRLLAAAAVQGMRFDASVLAASVAASATASITATQVELGAAIAVATRQRIIEHVDGDSYTFVHAKLRDTLLRALDRSTIASLHHRIALALEARLLMDDAQPTGHAPATDHAEPTDHAQATDHVQPTEHLYAIARHWAAAGTEPRRTYEACVAAGHRALASHASTDAVAFLGDAAQAAEHAGDTLEVEFRLTYATALVRSGRFDDAVDHLDAALDDETDPVRRAELLHLRATAECSAGDGDRAVDTVTRGLEVLGVTLPESLALLVVVTLARYLVILIAGAFPRWLHIGDTRLRRDAIEAALVETGVHAASAAVNEGMMLRFQIRWLLAVNRTGLVAASVRSRSGLGYLVAIAGAPRLGLRICASAERGADEIGDPTLIALTATMRGMVASLADDSIAPLADVLDAHGRWLDLPRYLTAVATMAPHVLSVGYTAVALTWVERARTRLHLGGAARENFSIECMAAAVQAVRGQAASAEASLRTALADLPDVPTRQQRLHLAWTRLLVLTEQGEFGDAFDDVVAEIEQIGLHAGNHHALAIRYTVITGRLVGAHTATTPDERERSLALARDSLRKLRRGMRVGRMRAGHQMFTAWMRHLQGRDRAALRTIHRASLTAVGVDSPLLTFDILAVRARILRSMGHLPDARRTAMAAHMLAAEYGWEYRARWVRGEFSLHDVGDRSRRTRSSVSGGRTSSGSVDIHQRRRLDAVTQLSATAASVLDPGELIRVALDITLNLLSAERVFVFLAEHESDRDEPVLVAHSGCDADGNELTQLTGFSSTLVDRVWQTGEVQVVTGTEQGAALGSQSAVVHGLRSILVAPLQLKGRTLGVIYLDSRVARGIFTPADADVLGAITQQIAASLETARTAQLEVAVQAATQQRDFAEALRASMADLNATLDPDEVLARLLRNVGMRLPGNRVVLLRVDHGGVRLVAPTDDAEADDPPAVLRRDASVTALVAITAPLTNVAASAVILPAAVSAALDDPTSWMAIPVRLRDETAGVIVVGSAQRNGYADVDVEVAAALAEQGAVAYQNARLFSRVEELATIDGLTGLATRHHFWQLAERQLSSAARYLRPLAAMMLDIDHFKEVNDTHGHAAGDAVLADVASRMRAVVREADIIGRYGGEEFALVLPETANASAFAERLRAAVAGRPVVTDGATVPVTISVGVSSLRAGDDLDALLGRADAALYQSKADGRNRVTIRS